ncbi:hypothetical protein [Ottowia testudinis]|uniref:Uncharacterized protein n=1 Tax=Ottowia testudinis TaxID=2816950 RepID=A0A975CFU0_9BURK|nr:hypothetical protein [Ottowia testudinis]QTD44077.1 hypothetical protein J1M35_13140 [Ottowia testudinis]
MATLPELIFLRRRPCIGACGTAILYFFDILSVTVSRDSRGVAGEKCRGLKLVGDLCYVKGMTYETKGNISTLDWADFDSDSILMQDSSYHTPCWRHWVNRQRASGMRDMTWDELHERWRHAFGAVESRAPKNTSLAEIERILHRSAPAAAIGRMH